MILHYFYKIKGLKHEVELTKDDFENLLIKESFLEKMQTKWFKSFKNSNIRVKEEMYTLRITDNKRKLIFHFHHKLIYDLSNKLAATSPYIINSNKEIINK